MSTELTMLAWGCVLALAHIFIAVRFKTRQYGTKWNMGARDEALPSPEPIVGRLARAQANFFETFPIGAITWLAARVVYLPLYAAGIAKVRTLVFLISVVGIALILWPALFG